MRQETFDTKWGKDHWIFVDSGEFPAAVQKYSAAIAKNGGSWSGDSWTSFSRKINEGDEASVAASEKMLTDLEDQVPVSRGWRNVDDVVGAVPNIPAFLAGHPQHMRRRERVSRDNAPLTIFMDLTSQASVSSYDVHRRGVTLLALVRLLVEHRPVELWCGAAQDAFYQQASGTTAWRIDTAPMDLARAGYHVAGTAMSRMFGYGINRHLFKSVGTWSFGSNVLQASTGKERAERAFGTEVLFIPRIMLADEMVKNPVGWVRREIQKYTGIEEDAA